MIAPPHSSLLKIGKVFQQLGLLYIRHKVASNEHCSDFATLFYL